jgi:DNA-binding response OmpR family regulator
VIILKDNSDDAELIVRELQQAGFAPTWRQVATEAEYVAHISDNPDIILAAPV